MKRRAAVIAALRTPIGRYGGALASVRPDDLAAVRESLEERLGPPREAQLAWKPLSTVQIEEGDADTLLRLLGALDDSDDVQQVSANFEISDDVMDRLTA